MNDLEIRLPIPPTVNHYWGERRNIKCRVCRQANTVPPKYLTKHAKEFRKAVARELIHQPGFGSALLAVRVDWFPPRDAGDIDNRIKPLLDALEDARLFHNDSQIKDLRVVWQHPVPGGYCRVKLWRI